MNRRILYLSALTVVLLLLVSCGKGFSENGIFDNSKAMVSEAKKDITEISYDDFKSKLDNKEVRVVIDVREPSEYEEGFINQEDEESGEYPYPDAFTVNIPRGMIEFNIGNKKYWDNDLFVEMPGTDEEIVVYCKSGGRSALAAQTLMKMGYRNVMSLKGGYAKWLDPSLPDVVEEETSDGG